MNQDLNLWSQKQSGRLNPSNEYVNGDLEVEEVANVAQCSDMAFFKRGKEWVDASLTLAGKGRGDLPVKEIMVGSEEFKRVVDRLVVKQRQSCLALGSNLELVVDGTRYRVK